MNTALGTVVVQSGTLTLTPGSPSRYTAVIGGTANGQASPALVGDNGTYTVAGANVSFTSGVLAGLTYVGVVSGNSISVAVPAFVIGTTGTLTLVLQKS